ncbi:enhancer of mRNA decapping [Coelomomyces lativittatus]|nr:enhancer of mRNA decapping [Coelomomyces lativittatus]
MHPPSSLTSTTRPLKHHPPSQPPPPSSSSSSPSPQHLHPPFPLSSSTWAHVDVQEVHETDFDFQGNLDKFDKSEVFAELHKSFSPVPSSRQPPKKSHSIQLPSAPVFLTSQKIKVPSATSLQMVEAERLASEEFGISSEMILTHASRGITEMVLDIFATHLSPPSNASTPSSKRVLFLIGNHRLGLCTFMSAVHLHRQGYLVTCVVPTPPSIPLLHTWIQLAQKSQVPCLPWSGTLRSSSASSMPPFDLIVDALLGLSSWDGISVIEERTLACNWISYTQTSRVPVLSIEIPSGFDASSGHALFPNYIVVPTWTLCLAIPKSGLRNPRLTGQLYLADLSFPSSLWHSIGIASWPSLPLFGNPPSTKFILPLQFPFQSV